MKTFFTWFGSFALASAAIAADTASTDVQVVPEDLSYSAALFEYHKGNYPDALLYLATADDQPVGDGLYRRQLAGHASLNLLDYETAQQYFDEVLGASMSSDLRNKIVFPLAKVKYAQGECQQTLDLLGGLTDLSSEQTDQIRYFRVSCMLKAANGDVEAIAEAERVLAQPLIEKQRDFKPSIWFAYGFYNLGVAIGKAGLTAEAVRLYEQALLYTGSSDEGRALSNRIKLNLAYTNYDINRYEFAMNAFSELETEGLWADKSLLGYGWAAFKNYKPGLALEAWRQLIYLPYKSLSVYEGYIAIPFALEKANAFSDALVAYEKAISEYDEVIVEIDQLESKLDKAMILKHALAYRNNKGQAVEPLHPLLGVTYSQENFRSAVEQIGVIDGFNQRLSMQINNLAILKESRLQDKANQQKDQQQRRQRELQLQEQLNQLQAKIHRLSNVLLETAMGRIADPQWQKGYARYQRLDAALQGQALNSDLMARLDRLRGVLLWQVYDEDPAVATDVNRVTSLTDAYQTLYASYVRYRELDRSPLQQQVDDQTIDVLEQRLLATKAKSEKLMSDFQSELLAMTRSALQAQKDRIIFYQKQARVANARLNEEFYQLGGRKL